MNRLNKGLLQLQTDNAARKEIHPATQLIEDALQTPLNKLIHAASIYGHVEKLAYYLTQVKTDADLNTDSYCCSHNR